MLLEKYNRCASDWIYTIDTYFKIPSPTGQLDFTLRDYQRNALQIMLSEADIKIHSARNMGLTAMLVSLAVVSCIFNSNYHVWYKAFNPLLVKNRIDLILDNLPRWLQLSVKRSNNYLIQFNNESSILLYKDINRIRSWRLNTIIFDNAEFDADLYTNFNEALASLSKVNTQSSLQYPSKTIISYNLITDDIKKLYNKYAFTRIDLPWNLNQEWDAAWAENMKKYIGEERFQMEYELRYK